MNTRRRSDGLIIFLGTLLIAQLCVIIAMELNLLRPFSTFVLRTTGFLPAPVASVPLTELGPVGVPTTETATTTSVFSLDEAPLATGTARYVQVITSCDNEYRGECVRVRAAPSATSTIVSKLREGMVLRVADEVYGADGQKWFKISFDEWLRYPERITSDWYINASLVEELYASPIEEVAEGFATGTKKIIVDRSEQQLYAYDGDQLFLQATTSTGLLLTPTPRGTFHVFRKVPSRYMQGPLPYLIDQEVYDLPGVPWTMYFTGMGAAIHGTYWHSNFGNPHSHGCVNLPPTVARELYYWTDLGTTVVVQD